MLLILPFVVAFVTSDSTDVSMKLAVAADGGLTESHAESAILLAHRSELTRHSFGENSRMALRTWRSHHHHIMHDADETEAELDAFIRSQEESGDACSSRLLEAKRSLDGLIHDLRSLTSQVDSHQEVLETEEENLKATKLSIKAARATYREQIKMCKKEREAAIADLTQYTAELEELKQIANPSVRSNLTTEMNFPVPLAIPAASLLEGAWTQEICAAFVDFAHRHLKKRRQYTFQVPVCSGPPECIGKDKATCKRMERQEGKCKWNEPIDDVDAEDAEDATDTTGEEKAKGKKKSKGKGKGRRPKDDNGEGEDAGNAEDADPELPAAKENETEVAIDPLGDFKVAEQPAVAEKRGKIIKHVDPIEEAIESVPTLNCNAQREELQKIFTKAYLALSDLQKDAKERSEDDTCFETAEADKTAKLVPLVAQRDQAAARIEYSEQALAALTPVLELIKQRTETLQVHIDQVLTPECSEADVVSKYLQLVRELIISLNECPGRNDFKLKVPKEDTEAEANDEFTDTGFYRCQLATPKVLKDGSTTTAPIKMNLEKVPNTKATCKTYCLSHAKAGSFEDGRKCWGYTMTNTGICIIYKEGPLQQKAASEIRVNPNLMCWAVTEFLL